MPPRFWSRRPKVHGRVLALKKWPAVTPLEMIDGSSQTIRHTYLLQVIMTPSKASQTCHVSTFDHPKGLQWWLWKHAIVETSHCINFRRHTQSCVLDPRDMLSILRDSRSFHLDFLKQIMARSLSDWAISNFEIRSIDLLTKTPINTLLIYFDLTLSRFLKFLLLSFSQKPRFCLFSTFDPEISLQLLFARNGFVYF